MSSDTLTTEPSDLIHRATDPSRPSLENRVAFQWENRGDTLGFRHGTIRDETILGYLASAVPATGPAAVLDVGCGYGNHLFMLNSQLGKRPELRCVGVNLDQNQLSYAQTFARNVEGYANCEFLHADLEKSLPFDDETFDAVGLSDVLEHMTSPAAALRELIRITKPGGTLVISTPLKGSLFKKLAATANACTGGRLYRQYYRGKNNTELDADGQPVMRVHAGHDHVSEMTHRQLLALFASVELRVVDRRLMQVMSGSRWFDRHPFVLSGVMLVEAMHGILKRPSWAHSATFKLERPARGAFPINKMERRFADVI
jgi:ubiquinone/menaquinone biosynthesis C-methylase UbiE